MASIGIGSLKKKFINGVAWTGAGYFLSQIIRFASSLILTRLLAPEHFGMMTIVTIFMVGLAMFSDIGLGPNIIQSNRSKDPDFLNTTFTIQFLRSGALFVVCLVAGYPLAVFYNQPLLTWLIPAAGIGTLIGGLTSTNVYTNNRDLNMIRITLIEVVSQVLALGAMIGVANLYPSVWVLVLGNIISAMVRAISSHLVLPGIRNRFRWDPSSMKELVHFGKWIFLSTLLSFASNSMGSLIMGKLVPMAAVGVFSIAATLAKTVEQVYEQISSKILLPVYTQIRSLPIDQLRKRVRGIRLGVMGLFLPMLWVLICFGDLVIQILFDNRYHGAGWILRTFAIGLIPTIISGIGPFYLAMGNSKLMMKMSGVKLVSYLASMLVGWIFLKSDGVIIGMACFTFFVYFADALVQRKYKVWLPLLDLLGFGSSLIVVGGFYLLWGFQ